MPWGKLAFPNTTQSDPPVFKAFQYRDFRLMWIGACTSSIGTWMQIAAQSWLVLKLSNSPFLLGLDAFLAHPHLSLLADRGVVADRIERRKVLLLSQCVQMGAPSCSPLSSLPSGSRLADPLPVVYYRLRPGLRGPLPGAHSHSVDKEDMPNAIALQSIQFNVARVIGPAWAASP